jgi:hypothetical protein
MRPMQVFGTTACSLVGKKKLSLFDSEEFVNCIMLSCSHSDLALQDSELGP